MQILLFKTERYWDQRLISSRTLALSMASSRCVGEQNDASLGILTQNWQNCSILAKGFIQIIMPFDLFSSEPCFSPVTPLRFQEVHVEKKAVLLYYCIYQTQLPPAVQQCQRWPGKLSASAHRGGSGVMSILVYPCGSWPCRQFSS